MNEWYECDQTEDCNNMPLLSMSCGERQPENEPTDYRQVPARRVKLTCTKTTAGNRQFVCSNNFEAFAEQSHDKQTKQDGNMVRLDGDSDASTSCGGCEEESGEKQAWSENGSEDDEGCKKDPNLVGILLSS